MSNTFTFVKIIVVNLVVATLVATYMFSNDSNNDSSAGLKGSRKLQPFFTTPPAGTNIQLPLTSQPGVFPNFPDFNSQTSPGGNFPNFPNFNPGSNPGFNFTPFVNSIKPQTTTISGISFPGLTSGNFSFRGFNPGFNTSVFNNQGGFKLTPIGFNAPTSSANASSQIQAIASSIFNATINSFNQIAAGGGGGGGFNFTPFLSP
jgi:hypothetical protein